MQKALNIGTKDNDKDNDGLPDVDPHEIDQYIEFYEKLMKKKLSVDVAKFRSTIMKRLSKKHNASKSSARKKNLKKRMEEVKAFYEGDIVKMDRTQADCDEPTKYIHWYDWDMVMVIPNPDYRSKEKTDNYLLDDPEEAMERYSQCFKKIYRENQVEMKKERRAELNVVKDVVSKKIATEDGRVLNRCGGRFQRSIHLQNNSNSSASSNDDYEGGKEEENLDIPDESVHAGQVREMSVHDTDEEDLDPFVDTREYCADFTTLTLNALIYRLNKILGFQTLLLVSKSGRDLYLLINAGTDDLKRHAQEQHYELGMEVGYTDLHSQPPFSLGKCSIRTVNSAISQIL